MKKEEKKPFIQCCILGAIGGILMAAGDWLLGCVPLQKTDTGMFNRACYLSGSYGLWKPVLTVGLGAVGGFLYYFVVKALNADIDARYTRTKAIQYFCGLFTVVVALSIHLWAATLAWFSTYLGPWGRVSERRPPSQRSQPIRMTCSPQSSPCMFRCYCFLASIS